MHSGVRKKDFRVELGLFPHDPDMTAEFVQSIHRVKPSMLYPHLILEVYQPLVGSVHETVFNICRYGMLSCGIFTLIPGRSDLDRQEICGHLVFLYEKGKVIDQQTPMSTDAEDGEDFMVHVLCLEFDHFDIKTNEFVGPQCYKKKPIFELVQNTGGGMISQPGMN